jgi:hypothetical protein
MSPSKLLPGAACGLPVRSLLATLCLTTLAALAEQSTNDMFQPVGLTEGGLSPKPVITAITDDSGMTTVRWSGFLKPFELQGSPSASSAVWQTLLSGITTTEASVAQSGDMQILRVGSPTPLYAGSYVCGACHEDKHAEWAETRHAGAYETLKSIHMEDPKYGCVACHTVGYGLPTGFRDAAATPQLEGVQCENCHGPGGQHIANTEDVSLRPVITIAAEVCGGCHTDVHHPTYEEWREAGHSQVTEENMFTITTNLVVDGVTNKVVDTTASVNRMYQCGVCHSGAVRRAVVNNYDAGGDGSDAVAPTIHDANTFAQVCTACHDPHERSTNVLLTATGQPLLDQAGTEIPAQPRQLRNPISSAKFMSFFTSTSPTNFAAQYDPNIQMCGQCHNERGATWTGTGRPPHHSPQYNILIGQAVDPRYDTNTLNGEPIHFNTSPAGHGDPYTARPDGNPYQCTACHNRAEEQPSPTPANPNYTGHRFQVQKLACAECHGFLDDPNAEEIAEGGIEFIQSGIHEGIADTIDALNRWSTNKITDLYVPGSTNYVAFIGKNNPASVVPWEFSTIGQLSPGKNSPPTAGQNRISKYAPQILQSRFLLYLVEHDASYGVHNPPYARYLLRTAQELADNAPPVPAN